MTRYITLLTTLVLGVAICGCQTVKPVPPPERSVRIDVQTFLIGTSYMGLVSGEQHEIGNFDQSGHLLTADLPCSRNNH